MSGERSGVRRRPIVAGNWKMNATQTEAVQLARDTVAAFGNEKEVEVVLCPPFTALAAVARILQSSSVGLGAQNLHWEPKGAFTGEISPVLLKDVGCRYVIVGHSERRHLLGETDADAGKKVQAALEYDLNVIVCVGEQLKERQGGKTWGVVERQLQEGLRHVGRDVSASKLNIAYEPVWAIGTDQNATPEEAEQVHLQIRRWLADRLDSQTAQGSRILYGGSVKPDNAQAIFSQPDVDGGLIGAASLEAKSFSAIVWAAQQAKKESKCSTA